MLRFFVRLTSCAVLATSFGCSPTEEWSPPLVFPGANSRATYFTMHNIAAAQDLSRGGGVRVGILDHGFGFDSHRGLYADGVDFRDNGALSAYAEHGYWMALTLREIAPDVEIVALNTRRGMKLRKSTPSYGQSTGL